MDQDNIKKDEENNEDNNKDNNQDAPVQPDPETLHTTDPQKKMEGPISSLLRKTGKGFNTDKTREEADEERDSNM